MNSIPTLHSISAIPINAENFAPYGQVIVASEDGKPFNSEDAQLQLDQGTPRFYIMRLRDRGLQFSRITRHQQCTQCLGALEGKDWLLAVAPPSPTAHPQLEDIVAFHIPGTCFVKLALGTWHAGPYFTHAKVDFYNLELADTNITDHETCNLSEIYGLSLMIQPSHD